MKRHLFYTFLGIFAATCIVTLLAVIGVLHIVEGYLPSLFATFIIESGGAVVALYKNAQFFCDDNQETQKTVANLEENHRKEMAQRDWKEAEMKEQHTQSEAQLSSASAKQIAERDHKIAELKARYSQLDEESEARFDEEIGKRNLAIERLTEALAKTGQ